MTKAVDSREEVCNGEGSEDKSFDGSGCSTASVAFTCVTTEWLRLRRFGLRELFDEGLGIER